VEPFDAWAAWPANFAEAVSALSRPPTALFLTVAQASSLVKAKAVGWRSTCAWPTRWPSGRATTTPPPSRVGGGAGRSRTVGAADPAGQWL
jgi:hypothetical protein